MRRRRRATQSAIYVMMRLLENVQSSRKYRRLTCAWREYGYFSLRRSQSDDVFQQSIPHIHHPEKKGSLKPILVCYLFINPLRAICHRNYQKPQLLYNDEYFMSPSCVNLFRVVFGRKSTVFVVFFFLPPPPLSLILNPTRLRLFLHTCLNY